MTPYEIMLSESQERMLVIAEPAQVAAIQAVCAKWELSAVPVGRVTDDGLFRIRHGKLVVAEIPGQRLVDDCPIYTPEAREGDAVKARRAARPSAPAAADLTGALPLLLDTPSIASKRWVYEQYDSTVQAGTLLAPGGDAGVLRIAGTSFGLAVTVDCNSRLLALDPYEGGKATVAEAARNVACTGALPLGITDCLNFGNPQKPEVFFQFTEACRGISDACRAFETPVTGGNVSFYNESPSGAIDPTPTVGMVGLLERIEDRVGSHFRTPGDRIVILGNTIGALGGSAYWADVRNFVGGRPATVDLKAERALQRILIAAARGGLLSSAHDCSTGGLAVAVAEAAVGGPYAEAPLGASIDLGGYAPGVTDEGLLYGEDGARAVVSVSPAQLDALVALTREHGVPAWVAGQVGAASGEITIATAGGRYQWPSALLRQTYYGAIPRRMSHVVEDRADGQ
jgi:phosphoribosylformylglycinamidine synthase